MLSGQPACLLSYTWVSCLPSALLQGYFDDQDENLTPLAQDVSQLPEEKLAFALGDGRVGLLAVKGRKVGAPCRPKTLLPFEMPALEHNAALLVRRHRFRPLSTSCADGPH